jgi:hypothetical protein
LNKITKLYDKLEIISDGQVEEYYFEEEDSENENFGDLEEESDIEIY